MNTLIIDLLEIGKIESGLEAPREPMDLVPLVHDVATALQVQAEAKNIALAVETPERVPVLATPGRITQALMNLAGNAVKYTPAGGRARIGVTVTPGGEPASAAALVTVCVTDTGIGIPAADLPYVFDKFYRVKSKATRDIEAPGSVSITGMLPFICSACYGWRTHTAVVTQASSASGQAGRTAHHTVSRADLSRGVP
jgi:signal transduction histidine kinase